ncbi:MAG: glycerate kinase [Ruminococcaceae bacterium]|nr:glycerate kinase [Oscillospiraceae bacterium]
MKMKKNLNIIAALDSFKGAASSYDAGCAVRRGIQKRFPDAEVTVFSLGDGGEGTSAAFFRAGTVCTHRVSDTHCTPVDANYVLLDRNGVKTAMFDMAAAAGLHHSRAHGLDIRTATTAGVGELIVHLVQSGCGEIIVGLGGSGTNDGGIGALSRMGAKFYDISGAELDGTGGAVVLADIAACDLSAVHALLDNVKLTLLYDVAVTLTGESGASRMFSRQKGADEQTVEKLETAMAHFSEVGDRHFGETISMRKGAGAAGGLGYGLSLAGGILRPGAEYVLDFVGFREALAHADLVITGEGKTDRQTAQGKLPFTAAKYARDAQVPVVCLCGTFVPDESLYEGGFDAVFSIINAPSSLDECMAQTEALLENAAYNAAGFFAAAKSF